VGRPKFDFHTGGARNSVVPKLTAYSAAAKVPYRLLAIADASARIGLELIGVALLLKYLEDTRVRITFRACAIAFHFGVALLTAIDFFENRVVLFVVAISDDLLGGGASAAACSPWPSRLFAFALLFPVLAGVEHFPFTHNGLFPFSGRQMRAVRGVCDHQGTLVATAKVVALPVDLARTFLGLGETQPAQLWHPVLAPLVLAAEASPIVLGHPALWRAAEAWLKAAQPLVDARTGRAYDRVQYQYKNRADRGYN
jgi:hypothetical protein